MKLDTELCKSYEGDAAMANKFLLPIYEKVFGTPFSYSDFDHRLQMQKMVYLLQEEGVAIGHYGFDWYKHGPYSQALLDDMYFENGSHCIQLNYTEYADECIKRIKDIFHDKEAQEEYGLKNWTECLASVHFLRYKELGSDVSQDKVLEVLKERKPHLNNDYLNKKAYLLIERSVA